MDKKSRGQFFTVNPKVQEALMSLVKNPQGTESAFEPSAGAGDLMLAYQSAFPQGNITGVELDAEISKRSDDLQIEYKNFFSVEGEFLYETIIGNPPYVALKHVEEETRNLAGSLVSKYSQKANLYYYFIDRCIDLLKYQGELVLIVPKEWFYATSAAPLRAKLTELGGITHLIDLGEEKLFPDADVPALMIFRWEKTSELSGDGGQEIEYKQGLDSEWGKKSFAHSHGYWLLLDEKQAATIESWDGTVLSDYFSVRVGIVSGADKAYNVTQHPDLEAFISEGTAVKYLTTKGIEHYIDVNGYNAFQDIPERTREHLLESKELLLSRRIAKFSEANWWKYGAIRNRNHMLTTVPRLYTYGRTRSTEPFFTRDDAVFYSGGILGLFLKPGVTIEREKLLKFLNSQFFRDTCSAFGLTTGNKVSFQPATLEKVPFPPESWFKTKP